MALPLEGIKILDLSTMLPGPFCSMILADFGAEVIKVEAVKGGDLFRGGAPKIGDTGGAFFQVNRNKKASPSISKATRVRKYSISSQRMRTSFWSSTAPE